MKKIIFLAVLFILVNTKIFSQNNFIFSFVEGTEIYSVQNLVEINNKYYVFATSNISEPKCLEIDNQGNLLETNILTSESKYIFKNNEIFVNVELQNIESNYSKFDIVISEFDLNFNLLNSKTINFVNPYTVAEIYYHFSNIIINNENEMVFTINFFDTPISPNNVVVFKISESYELITTKKIDISNKIIPVDIDYIPQNKGYIITSLSSPIPPWTSDAGFFRLDKDFNIEKIHVYSNYNNASNYYDETFIKFLTDSTFAINGLRFCGLGYQADRFELIKSDTTFQIID